MILLTLGRVLRATAASAALSSLIAIAKRKKEMSKTYNGINSYVYLHHTDKFVVLPVIPESIQDQMTSTFSTTNPLARSAPIFAYSNSGPRTMQISLTLHREMMTQVNLGVSNLNVEVGDDYVDTIIKELQSIAVPKYAANNKMVNPPMVSLRIGNEIFIKGVVSGNVGVEYKLPILENDKYAQVVISFPISEVDPYDATTIAQQGSFRGLDTSLDRRISFS